MASTSPFHLAFTVRDISETRAFFGGLLGCAEGFVEFKGTQRFHAHAVAGAPIERRNAPERVVNGRIVDTN